MKPIVGVTTRPKVIASSAGESSTHTVNRAYTDSVQRAGGLPLLLAPIPVTDLPALVARIDGIVLTGGGDIDPSRYGGRHVDTLYDIDFDRDEFELALAEEAFRRKLPILAICRGLQVVNVALGGTLIEDIPLEIGSADHTVIGHAVFEGHQKVQIDEHSRVAEAIGKTEILVNSIHHQAVRDLAPDLEAVAWAGDGVIEAVQHDDAEWPLLAVQWHPEYLGNVDDEASLALFARFVASCRQAPAET